MHGKPFPRKVCPEHTPSGGCTRGAVALGGWRRQEGGGGGSAGTPTGEARSPTGAPGSHRPTGDSFLPSFFPSFLLPSSFSPEETRSFPSQEPAVVVVKWQRGASGQPQGGGGRGSFLSSWGKSSIKYGWKADRERDV